MARQAWEKRNIIFVPPNQVLPRETHTVLRPSHRQLFLTSVPNRRASPPFRLSPFLASAKIRRIRNIPATFSGKRRPRRDSLFSIPSRFCCFSLGASNLSNVLRRMSSWVSNTALVCNGKNKIKSWITIWIINKIVFVLRTFIFHAIYPFIYFYNERERVINIDAAILLDPNLVGYVRFGP